MKLDRFGVMVPMMDAAGDAGAGGAGGDKGGAPAGETPEQKTAREAAEAAETPEQKTAREAAAGAGKKGGAADGGSKDGDKPKAPDKYELKLPDGSKDWLDDSDLKAIEGLARAKGWTNEQAQTALDEHANSLATQSASFRAETEKDPTFGGDNLAETQRLASLALDRIEPADTDEGKALRRILARSGYGNKLEVVRFLAKAGKMMAEDTGTGGSGGGGGKAPRDAASVLYGKTK